MILFPMMPFLFLAKECYSNAIREMPKASSILTVFSPDQLLMYACAFLRRSTSGKSKVPFIGVHSPKGTTGIPNSYCGSLCVVARPQKLGAMEMEHSDGRRKEGGSWRCEQQVGWRLRVR